MSAPFRLLLISSTAWGALSTATPVLREMFDGPHRGAVLLHRDVTGLERAAGAWWRRWGGQTETVPGYTAEVIREADAWLAFCYDRCPQAMAALHLTSELGVPGAIRSEGRPAWWPEEDVRPLRVVPQVGRQYRRRAA